MFRSTRWLKRATETFRHGKYLPTPIDVEFAVLSALDHFGLRYLPGELEQGDNSGDPTATSGVEVPSHAAGDSASTRAGGDARNEEDNFFDYDFVDDPFMGGDGGPERRSVFEKPKIITAEEELEL